MSRLVRRRSQAVGTSHTWVSVVLALVCLYLVVQVLPLVMYSLVVELSLVVLFFLVQVFLRMLGLAVSVLVSLFWWVLVAMALLALVV